VRPSPNASARTGNAAEPYSMRVCAPAAARTAPVPAAGGRPRSAGRASAPRGRSRGAPARSLHDALKGGSEKVGDFSWANFRLLSLYSHTRNAWANVHLMGQPNTFLVLGFGRVLAAEIYVRSGWGAVQSSNAAEPDRNSACSRPGRGGGPSAAGTPGTGAAGPRPTRRSRGSATGLHEGRRRGC
jgi:hypothetical protein